MASDPITPNPEPATGSIYCKDPACKSCKDLKDVQRELLSAK